jgi:hypothetical protein
MSDGSSRSGRVPFPGNKPKRTRRNPEWATPKFSMVYESAEETYQELGLSYLSLFRFIRDGWALAVMHGREAEGIEIPVAKLEKLGVARSTRGRWVRLLLSAGVLSRIDGRRQSPRYRLEKPI